MDAPVLRKISLRSSLSIQLQHVSTVIATLLAIPPTVLAVLKQLTWLFDLVRIAPTAVLPTPASCPDPGDRTGVSPRRKSGPGARFAPRLSRNAAEVIMYDRRSFLIGSAGAAALALAPRMAFAKAETDRRFVFIIQRGAADGLGTIGA